MKTRFLFFSLFWGFLSICLTMEPVDSLQTIPMTKVYIYAHRSAGDLTSEKILFSFGLIRSIREVLKMGIRTARDSVHVMFFNNEFHRILPTVSDEIRDKPICELIREIKDLVIGSAGIAPSFKNLGYKFLLCLGILFQADYSECRSLSSKQFEILLNC